MRKLKVSDRTTGEVPVAAEAIRDLRRRLSGDPEKPISQQRFSQLLGVALSTVARWESGGTPDPQTAKKLVALSQALNILGVMVRPEHRLAFFEQHHPLLLGMRPIDLLGSESGAKQVFRVLEGARSGGFA
jgi:DNA-binding transcriptional regulator YiaG